MALSLFLLGTNIGEVIAVFVAMLLWHKSPLLSMQLLWINLVTDSLPAIALGMENVEADIMNRKPRDSKEGIFAGGLGFAFISYLNASLEKGIKLIIEKTGLEDKIKCADLVVTGEGRLDFQTAMGKAPVGVAEIAEKYGVPTIAFAGCVTKDAGECNNHGIKAFFPILREICTLEKAMNKDYARVNLERTAEQVFRLMK